MNHLTNHSDASEIETTKTERLMRNAMSICQSVTGKEDIGEALLCSAIDMLRAEQEENYESTMGEMH
jgi:hypothetical protein